MDVNVVTSATVEEYSLLRDQLWFGLAGTLADKVLDAMSDAPEADLRRADDLVSKILVPIMLLSSG